MGGECGVHRGSVSGRERSQDRERPHTGPWRALAPDAELGEIIVLMLYMGKASIYECTTTTNIDGIILVLFNLYLDKGHFFSSLLLETYSKEIYHKMYCKYN